MSNYQIRIRTDVAWEQLDYISDWLKEANKGFCFEHNKPGNHHYHVYLFGLERNDDAMRRHLGKHLPNKECYAIGKTCGTKKKKRPVEPEGAYTYGTTKALMPPKWVKGFTNDAIDMYRFSAEKFYSNEKPGESDKIEQKEKVVKVPYQQAVIASASADWYNYKRQCKEKDESPDPRDVIDFVCKGMREHGRGINPYLVKEISYAVLHDDLDYRERILSKIKYEFNV